MGHQVPVAEAFLASVAEATRSDCSFVTILLSEDFLPCSVALVRSIRQSQTVHEVTALVLPEISENARDQILEAGADQVVTAQEIQNPNEVVQYQAFAKNYAILRVWQLEELTKKAFHRAVYMDSDMIMTKNSDHLCDQPELSAARDLATNEAELHSEDFNAGLMVLEPSEATFQRLVQLAPHISSPSGGVQPLLRAAFSNFHPLDHLRDNVNARLFDLRRGSWRFSEIRSIHYTGPVKPCFTLPSDFADEDWEQPMRVWHRFQQVDMTPGLQRDEAHAGSQMSAAEAWRQWWPLAEDSVLVTLFGAGEEELKALGASHVSKHVSAAMSKCAEQVFASGYRQLLACQGGACSPVSMVAEELERSGDLLQRTSQLFLQRCSKDAQVDVHGLGAVEQLLLQHLEETQQMLRQSLKQLRRQEPKSCIFHITTALAKALRDKEEVMRWHLSHALLGLLWWQLQHQRGELQAPEEFHFDLPTMEFSAVCCRRWDVFLEAISAKDAVVAAFNPDERLQEWIPGLVPLNDLPEVEEVQPQILLLGCGGSLMEPVEDYLLLRSQLEQLWLRQELMVMGCDFLAKRPGLVEAVSQHALQASLTLHLGVDATWWFQREICSQVNASSRRPYSSPMCRWKMRTWLPNPGFPLGAAKWLVYPAEVRHASTSRHWREKIVKSMREGHLHQTDHRPSSILADAGHSRVMRRENELQNAFAEVSSRTSCPNDLSRCATSELIEIPYELYGHGGQIQHLKSRKTV